MSMCPVGKLLIVSTDAGVLKAMTEQFPAGDEFQVETATNGFEAGWMIGNGRPDAVMIDLCKGVGMTEGIYIAGHLRCCGMRTIIALADLDEPPLDALGAAGFTHVFYRPFDPAAVAGLVCARIVRRST